MPDALERLNWEVVDEARVMTLPELPEQVNVPPMVWVVPAVKVTVWGAVKVRLLKVELPEIACDEPFRVTVPVAV